MMLLTELQTYSLSHLANLPFSSSSSGDNSYSFITEKGLDILAGVGKTGLFCWLLCILLVISPTPTVADDATLQMFGDVTDGLPAAFGDFNSDELTDIFVIRDGGKTLEILLGQDKEAPMHVRAGLNCSFARTQKHITSVVPGDFNGDALMDVMVTLWDASKKDINDIVLLWGEMDHLNCTDKTLIQTIGQPLAIDYDKNMIIDLFGVDVNGNRSFWLFSKNKTISAKIPMGELKGYKSPIRIPHSHSFVDLNNDNLADLYITTEDNFEIWRGNEDRQQGFTPWKIIPLPDDFSKNKHDGVLGQTVFLDVESNGKLVHLVPVCYDQYCRNSSILVFSGGRWHNLNVDFHGWAFPYKTTLPYTNTITLRAGDFDMDGYPDLLTTLTNGKEFKSFFLRNIPCPMACSGFSRTFELQWKDLSPYNNGTVLGVFYDFQQDGVLDIIFVHYKSSNTFSISAYKNTVNYDANFVKVMVVTGLTNKEHRTIDGPLRKSGKVYGTNLPGPKVLYATTTQDGEPKQAVAAQIPQSAHFALNLPYTIFGLGRTPNFIENLTVQVYGRQREWNQLIPNSQMVVIPWPIEDPFSWKVQLFVTPSKLITQSILALLATCVVIAFIIGALYWKERKEDHLEKLQEAHRFHFDAM